MGIVSSAVAGHLDNSAATIGALAIGVSIFNFIYWNCSFVRMGTSGLTAQAFGAGNFHECTNMLVRGILVAAILGLLVICFQNPLGRLALWAMNGNEIVHDYFYARIWAVPAGIMLFGFNGWYTGMQNAVIPMCIAVTVNIVHVSTSLWLVFDTAWASRASPMARSWPKIRGPAGGPAAYPAIPQNSHTVYVA